jgi:hypothetical protein
MKTIVIRGCKFRISIKQARKLEKLERQMIRQEWATNELP